jgi:hypothetical protein
MSRVFAVTGLIAVLTLAVVWAAPAPPQPPAKLPAAFRLADALTRDVEYGGIDDPKTSLAEALDMISKRYDVPIHVNETAFQASNLQDVLKTEITADRPIPAMKARLGTVIRKVLSRVPADSGAAITLRRDGIEITTGDAQRIEFWGAEHTGNQAPLVHAYLDRKPLEEALREIADAHELNIVLDPKAGEKGKTIVSARLLNTPADAALDVLANMADLKTVAIRNVYFVTTPEKAKEIEKAQEEKALRQLAPLGFPPGGPALDGFGIPRINPGLGKGGAM